MLRINDRISLLSSLGVPRKVADRISCEDVPKRTIQFKAADDSGNSELLLYDFIGYDWWSDSGITAQSFAESLAGLADSKHLTVRINSPGGDVWDGLSIFNQLSQFAVPTTVIVDGIAASVASVIAMAGDVVKAAEVSQIMIHDSWTIAAGNEAQLREVADVLAKIDQQIAEVYATRSGKDAIYFRELQNRDSYLTAAEALDMGLVDEVIKTTKQAPPKEPNATMRASAIRGRRISLARHKIGI